VFTSQAAVAKTPENATCNTPAENVKKSDPAEKSF